MWLSKKKYNDIIAALDSLQVQITNNETALINATKVSDKTPEGFYVNKIVTMKDIMKLCGLRLKYTHSRDAKTEVVADVETDGC